ncbi:TetR/AcrR family transcriptional regulator [Neomicrococcus lactis]|uniref:TetR/AcrR family transcriptional regulator n=1 Tax=Neomicrococcus lactis TaxID=732241 RepID=UPI0022FFEA5B|nr:TetR/AcrR family transcriptional regulator [Neomicrococcus lactis]
MKPVNTKPYHHGNLREELVRVGLELAHEGGASAIKLREAARRIGVSPSAAYRHFDGQEGLASAVKAEILHQLTQAMSAEVEALPEGATPLEKICAAGHGFFDFAINSVGLYPALMETVKELPHLSDELRPKVNGELTAIEEALPSDRYPFTYILTLVAQTNVHEGELTDATLVMWAAVDGMSTLCSTGALRNEPVESKTRLFDLAMRSMVSGLNL